MLTISSTPSTNTKPVPKTRKGTLYCGITLDWNYKQHHLDISMPKYIPKLLQRFKHKAPTHPQHSLYQASPKTYWAAAQYPMTVYTNNKVNEPRIKNIKRIVGAILYYARAVDHTILTALISVAGDRVNARA